MAKREAEPESQSPYKATAIPKEVRNAFGAIGSAWKRRNYALSDFEELLKEAGYDVTQSSLSRWVLATERGGSALSADKASGRESMLSDAEQRVLAGWVLTMNFERQPVNLQATVDFISDSFSINVSATTAHRYLKGLGFTRRKVSIKAATYTLDDYQLAKQVHNWLLGTVFPSSRSLLASIDVTYSGHRKDEVFTYAPKGGGQPSHPKRLSRFTNCFVTCLWADGVNRTPPVLFTRNIGFRRDGKKGPSNKRRTDYLKELLDHYEIDYDRVVYLKEGKDFVRESPDIFREFFKLYEVPAGATILSDEGLAFFPDGKSVLLELGFANHLTYPPAVHQLLSPNDNRLHGLAKADWRAANRDFSDDVHASTHLLYLLDYYSKHARKWFKKNLQLDEAAPTFTKAMELVGGHDHAKGEFHARCLREYVRWKKSNGSADEVEDVEAALDGDFWT